MYKVDLVPEFTLRLWDINGRIRSEFKDKLRKIVSKKIWRHPTVSKHKKLLGFPQSHNAKQRTSFLTE